MTLSLGARIKETRESMAFSQEQLAIMLGVSRPTLTQIEADKRKLSPEELKKLSLIFDISIDFLLSGKKDQNISIPTEQKEKFEKLILYILSKVWAKYNVGKVVLYKLLYFSEFDFFEMHGKNLSGYPFIKLPMGPAPWAFDSLIWEMKERHEMETIITEYNGYFQQRFIPNIPVFEDTFSHEEQSVIDDVLKRYSDYSARDISEKSHEDKPWQIANDMEIIAYDLVRFREYPFSPLARTQKKQETQSFAKMTGFFDDLASEPDLYEEYR